MLGAATHRCTEVLQLGSQRAMLRKREHSRWSPTSNRLFCCLQVIVFSGDKGRCKHRDFLSRMAPPTLLLSDLLRSSTRSLPKAWQRFLAVSQSSHTELSFNTSKQTAIASCHSHPTCRRQHAREGASASIDVATQAHMHMYISTLGCTF
jgi:hypothetical protein